MSSLVAFLLLWGLALGPETEALVYIETRPTMWAESSSPLEPWANMSLVCLARLPTLDFQLLKNGAALEPVRVSSPLLQHRFTLGEVASNTAGLYRCRVGVDRAWSTLSNLVEVAGSESLAPPRLSVKQGVSWITRDLNLTLLCRGEMRGVTFLLRREGDDEFLEVVEGGEDGEASFPVRQAGNYSCSYRTHPAGAPSEPSEPVTIQELATPPRPLLTISGESADVVPPGALPVLVCLVPLSNVHFQLRRGEQEVQVSKTSTSPSAMFFHLPAVAPENGGRYTCRYRLQGERTAWSADSPPVELLVSDETLPAPELSAEPASPNPAPGTLVRLRCRAPRAGLRFALVREDMDSRQVERVLSPAGAEAHFELRNVSAWDSAKYSCVYTDPEPPFGGSAPSARLPLSVDGPLPRPRLQALWSGAVPGGRDAVLRCEGPFPDVTFELLREGETEASAEVRSDHSSANLELTYVGPQHAGNYTCRYRVWWPRHLQSGLSDPVELLVAGS